MTNYAHDEDAFEAELEAGPTSDDSATSTHGRWAERSEHRTEKVDTHSGQLSIIGPGLVFKGDLSAEEDLLIQGRVEGSVKHTGANLTIGAHGKIKADVIGRKVIVQGEVRGDIRASESIHIEMAANVQGNVFAPRVAIKDGARFKGSVDMDGASVQSTARSSENAAGANPKGNGKTKRRAGRGEIGDPSVDALLD
jgi:cytoskeletal protein CcmA (bactofilin family)